MQDIMKEIRNRFNNDPTSLKGSGRKIAVFFYYTGLSVVRDGRQQVLINTNDDSSSYFDIELALDELAQRYKVQGYVINVCNVFKQTEDIADFDDDVDLDGKEQ